MIVVKNMSRTERNKEPKVSIYLAYHKDSVIFKSGLYRPIHVGAAASSLHLEIERDDVGNNISLKNPQYGELTALYWAWKNDFDSEYIGLGHYRRIPMISKRPLRLSLAISYLKYFLKRYFVLRLPRGEYFLSQTLRMQFSEFKAHLNEQEFYFQNMISKNAVLVPRRTYFATNSVKSFFNRVVPDSALKDIEMSISNQLIKDDFRRMLGGNSMYIANIFVMRRDIYDSYCEFLFNTLGEFVERSEQKGLRYSSRFLGYVGELLTSCYIIHLQEKGVLWSSFDLAEITNV